MFLVEIFFNNNEKTDACFKLANGESSCAARSTANLYTQENGYLVFPVDKKERPGNVDTSSPVVDTYGGGGNDSDSENTVPVPELDNVDEIILDDSFKDTKAECVYNKLYTLSGGFQKAIQKFDGEFPVSHLNFSVSYDLPSNTNGMTYPPEKFITRIEINGNNLDRPNLDVARTIEHETIHAEMFRKLLSAAQKGELNTDEWTQAEIVQYIKNMQNDFPGIYHFYYLQYKKYGEGWDHEQMAGYYRGYMVNLLKQFDPSQPEELYEAMAWEGLKGTEIWNSLSSAEKSRINNLAKNYNDKGGEPCE